MRFLFLVLLSILTECGYTHSSIFEPNIFELSTEEIRTDIHTNEQVEIQDRFHQNNRLWFVVSLSDGTTWYLVRYTLRDNAYVYQGKEQLSEEAKDSGINPVCPL